VRATCACWPVDSFPTRDLSEVPPGRLVVPTRVQASPEPEHLLDPERLVNGPFLIEIADLLQHVHGLVLWGAPQDPDLAGRGPGEAGSHPQERRLARPIWADKGRDPALRQLEGAILQAPGPPVSLAETGGLECGHSLGHLTALSVDASLRLASSS
jgi:hypothetical protein